MVALHIVAFADPANAVVDRVESTTVPRQGEDIVLADGAVRRVISVVHFPGLDRVLLVCSPPETL